MKIKSRKKKMKSKKIGKKRKNQKKSRILLHLYQIKKNQIQEI